MKLYLAKKASEGGYYYLGRNPNFNNQGFNWADKIEHFCPTEFERYVVLMQDGYEVTLEEGYAYPLKSITIELKAAGRCKLILGRRWRYEFAKEESNFNDDVIIKSIHSSVFSKYVTVVKNGEPFVIEEDTVHKVKSIVFELV
jgi:hypothetical protein